MRYFSLQLELGKENEEAAGCGKNIVQSQTYSIRKENEVSSALSRWHLERKSRLKQLAREISIKIVQS